VFAHETEAIRTADPVGQDLSRGGVIFDDGYRYAHDASTLPQRAAKALSSILTTEEDKAENRNLKREGNPKAEVRPPRRRVLGLLPFGLRGSVLLCISDFQFRNFIAGFMTWEL
jgi:hypothetical protein